MTEQQARDFLAALGAEIATWRRRKKLTRAQLGRLVDVSETTIGRIERGGSDAAVATSDVWRIAAALGLSFSDLVRRAEDMAELSEDSSTLGAVASTETTIEPGDLEE
jgi:transcriptional regulator with XRE-family HTH domain